VVGILAPTGTPVDRTLHINMASMEAIHLDWAGGAPMPGLEIPPELVRKFDLTPKEATAALVGLKNRAAVFKLQRRINEGEGEPLLAVMPGVALDQLWTLLSSLERTLMAISAMVVAVGLAGMVAVVLASLGERRRELAILRSVGAGAGRSAFCWWPRASR
jgi:putative ABC transport system permease protein